MDPRGWGEIYEPPAPLKQSMIEIIILAVAVLLFAKRTPKRRRFNLRRVRYSTELALSTLGSDTALLVSITGVGDAQYRMITMKGTWNISSDTAGDGPVTVGYAHSDYSVTEVKECLEAFAAIAQGDKIANERANRLIRTVGTFRLQGNGDFLNDGKPLSTKLNWLIAVGDSVNMFVFNESTSALTTGATVNHQGDCWVRDAS